jgi:hypothetical protein
MKKLAAVFVVPVFAGYLCAQTTQTETTTTTTTINGTLIDEGCRTTHVKSTSETDTTKTESNKWVTECPVSTTTTSFGLVTPEGKYVRLDDTGNTRVVEMVKANKNWNTFIVEHKPIKVHVVGSHHGDVLVVKEIK